MFTNAKAKSQYFPPLCLGEIVAGPDATYSKNTTDSMPTTHARNRLELPYKEGKLSQNKGLKAALFIRLKRCYRTNVGWNSRELVLHFSTDGILLNDDVIGMHQESQMQGCQCVHHHRAEIASIRNCYGRPSGGKLTRNGSRRQGRQGILKPLIDKPRELKDAHVAWLPSLGGSVA